MMLKDEFYIYTGPTGNNARLGFKVTGQELDFVPAKFISELLRNGQIKIKSKSAGKKSKKIIEQQVAIAAKQKQNKEK